MFIEGRFQSFCNVFSEPLWCDDFYIRNEGEKLGEEFAIGADTDGECARFRVDDLLGGMNGF